DIMPSSPRRERTMSEATRILSAIEQGDPSAAEQLLPLVYDELRRLAAQRLAQETGGQTLQATALVHEAYLRLVDAPSREGGGPPPAGGGGPRRGGGGGGISAGPAPRRCAAPSSTPPAASAGASTAASASGSIWTRASAWRSRTTTCWPWMRPSPGSASGNQR